MHTLDRVPSFESLLPYAAYFKLPLLFILGLFSGDLILHLSSGFLSGLPRKSGGPAARIEMEKPYLKNRQVFEEVIRRNPFCPGCPVPDIKALVLSRPKDCYKARLMPNGSGLKVIGTIALSDPNFSVATIQLGSAESQAIKKGDPLSGYGTVFEIHRDRICFEKSDGFLGYIDIPEEKVSFGQPLAATMTPSAFEGISRTGDNEVEIKRSFLLEKINDPNILFQAQAVAYRDPVTNVMKGFKILSVVPGSVYEAMDIRGDDVIVEVNGEPMNSLQKAQELYGAAASADELTLGILRGGQPVSKKFKVKQ